MSLKPLQETDLCLILPWRNDPAVRQAMFSQHEISYQEHQAWFLRTKNDPGAHWFIWHDADNVPQGVVYFTELDVKQKNAFWGFYTSPSAPPGSGTRMALEAIDYVLGEFSLIKLNSEVLASNTRSLIYHKKIGFIEGSCFREKHFNEAQHINVIRLCLLASAWPLHRLKLQSRIAGFDALVKNSIARTQDQI